MHYRLSEKETDIRISNAPAMLPSLFYFPVVRELFFLPMRQSLFYS